MKGFTMNEDSPKKSFKDRIKPNIRQVATCSISGIAGGAAVVLYYKYRTTVTWCNITMESVDFLKENGQGVIGFGTDTRDKILVALPDKV
jgi:hypothetical protein